MSSMKVSVDVHFGYGAVFGAGSGGGTLIGLYANESIGILFFIGSTAAYVGFLLLTMFVHHARQEWRMEKARREHREDLCRESVRQYALQPIALEPMVEPTVELSSLRSARR